METWFEVWMDKIEPVQVERHTDKCVWVGGRRHSREGWRHYFPTWQEAHTYLLGKAESDLNSARLVLAREQGRYGNIKGMRPPVTEGASNE